MDLHRRPHLRRFHPIALVLPLVVACSRGGESTLVGALRDAGPYPRHLAGRLTVETTDAAKPPASGRLATIGGRIADAARSGLDVDALHADALLGLVSDAPSKGALDLSISTLATALRVAPPEAQPALLSDAAAAYIARADRDGDARDLLAAVDLASRATGLDSTRAASQFNRALAASKFGLDRVAARAWRRYLALDSTSHWAAEARRALAGESKVRLVVAPEPSAPIDSLIAFATAHPQEARVFAWDRLLVDAATSPSHLAAARAVGDAIARVQKDWSVADAVASLERASPSDRRFLADAHRDYVDAKRLARESKLDSAIATYDRAARAASSGGSPAFRIWAAYGHANAMLNGGRDGAIDALGRVATSIDESRYPAIAGQAWWAVAVAGARAGTTDAVVEQYDHSRRIFARLGVREYVAALDHMIGEDAIRRGELREGIGLLHRGLVDLRETPNSVWRHNGLVVLNTEALTEGFPDAARAISEEDVAIAEAGPASQATVVEAALVNARALLDRGDTAAGRRALDKAQLLVSSMRDEGFGAQLRLDIAATRAGELDRRDASRALPLLDSVIGRLDTARVVKLVAAVLARGEIRLAAGDTRGAETDFTRIDAIQRRLERETKNAATRVAVREPVARALDALTMLRVRAGRTREAAGAWPKGLTGVRFSLIGDTIVAWRFASDSVHATTTTVSAARVERAVQVATAALERRLPSREWMPALSDLYEMLVRPIEARLPRDGALTIAVDGVLSGVPFAALRDTVTGQYLLQRYAIRMLAGGTARPSPRPGGEVVIIADPSFDRRIHPSLAPLSLAGAEADSIARHYPGSTRMQGAKATAVAVERAFRGARIVHFAGHAIFDESRASQSSLVLTGGELPAGRIAAMNLRGLELVVLSACETTRAAQRRTAGLTGMAEAFAAAGARGVVGSLWRVNDRDAARLMPAFHRYYVEGADAATALRRAQLESIGEPPWTWGAFVYLGR